MAFYTPIGLDDIRSILSGYELGEVIDFDTALLDLTVNAVNKLGVSGNIANIGIVLP